MRFYSSLCGITLACAFCQFLLICELIFSPCNTMLCMSPTAAWPGGEIPPGAN